MSKRVMVTGGMGFVASNIALKFIEDGYETILLDIAQIDIDYLDKWKAQWQFVQGGVDDWRKLVETAKAFEHFDRTILGIVQGGDL